MIPPTHKTMNVGANLTVLWCESVCDNWPGPVRNTVSLCLHVAKNACPGGCLLTLMFCVSSYEYVSSVWWGNILIHVSLCFFTVRCSLRWRWVDLSLHLTFSISVEYQYLILKFSDLYFLSTISIFFTFDMPSITTELASSFSCYDLL